MGKWFWYFKPCLSTLMLVVDAYWILAIVASLAQPWIITIWSFLFTLNYSILASIAYFNCRLQWEWQFSGRYCCDLLISSHDLSKAFSEAREFLLLILDVYVCFFTLDSSNSSQCSLCSCKWSTSIWQALTNHQRSNYDYCISHTSMVTLNNQSQLKPQRWSVSDSNRSWMSGASP